MKYDINRCCTVNEISSYVYYYLIVFFFCIVKGTVLHIGEKRNIDRAGGLRKFHLSHPMQEVCLG